METISCTQFLKNLNSASLAFIRPNYIKECVIGLVNCIVIEILCYFFEFSDISGSVKALSACSIGSGLLYYFWRLRYSFLGLWRLFFRLNRLWNHRFLLRLRFLLLNYRQCWLNWSWFGWGGLRRGFSGSSWFSSCT